MSIDRINDILWWTGSIVWMVIGGGVIVSFLAAVAAVFGALAWGYLERIAGDRKAIFEVRAWVRAGRPKAGSGILTRKDGTKDP